jgi:hypothetical protein
LDGCKTPKEEHNALYAFSLDSRTGAGNFSGVGASSGVGESLGVRESGLLLKEMNELFSVVSSSLSFCK